MSDYTPLDTPGASVTLHSDLTVEAEATYQYRIRAVGPGGESAWVESNPVTTPAGSVPLPFPNEPAGLTPLFRYEANSLAYNSTNVEDEEGNLWATDSPSSRLYLDTDASAPVAGPNVLVTKYPANWPSGSGTVNFFTRSSSWPGEMRRLYTSYRIKWLGDGSDPLQWECHSTAVKQGFWGVGGGSARNELFASVRRQGADGFQLPSGHYLCENLTPRFDQQNFSVRNVSDTTFKHWVGQWYQWEFLFELNDIGQANGVLRWWVDGELVFSRSDWVFRTATWPTGFRGYKWNPTFGGSGGPKSARDDYVLQDQIYISGELL